MRARNLKPGIYKNYELARLGDSAFRLFTGLWGMADRLGRLKDEPEKIQAEIFPFRFQKVNIRDLMDALASGEDPFIIRYEANGRLYVQIVNFLAHQNPHPRESSSDIPPCKKKAIPRHGLGNAKDMTSRAGSSDVQDLLNPELTPLHTFDFAKVYDQYPNKDSRKGAEKHFHASVKTDQDFLDIQKAVSAYTKHLQTETWKQPQSAKTWFNNWRDWVNYKTSSSGLQSAVHPPPARKPDPRPEELPTMDEIKAAKAQAGLARRA